MCGAKKCQMLGEVWSDVETTRTRTKDVRRLQARGASTQNASSAVLT